MLTKWFGTRTPCHRPTEHFVRPELEALEDRLPPSSVQGMGGDNGNGGGPPGHNNVHIQDNVHNNIHINITNSFNGSTITSALSGQNLGLMALPQSSLQGFFAMLYTKAAAIDATAANALVGEEAQLAIDAFLTFEGIPGLSANISTLQTQIAANEATLDANGGVTGLLLGQVAFDVVLEGLVTSPLSSQV